MARALAAGPGRAGPGTAYTHPSSTILHVLHLWGRNRDGHVNVPYQASPSRQAPGFHRHVQSLTPDDVTAGLAELLDRMAGRRGVRRTRNVVAALNALSESAGESRTRLIIAHPPIEVPELQVTLNASGRSYRVDFAADKTAEP
ncbi:hypothetical protein [Arthrobacter dokdonensis]|uniref:hypothetical protein n=1 Tax=Arthrobacter dokdonellae TaxID=2211210 RepID=UPI000DE59F96|nr:hypothetical protein [Arthrobacter dokdonellae]